ncbi:MAG: ornithine carbamoyltransferase [Chloroflexi bacterium]|nr:ornithine carbamoyltransferase [Chloroflexota bacterium]
MKPRHLLSITNLSPQEVEALLQRALDMKQQGHDAPLAGKTVAMLFEKPSLRTKVSFDVGIQQLGGHPIYMGRDEVGLGGREPVADVARVLSRYVDAIVARVFSHKVLEEMAAHSSVPVVNALSDVEHPCQAMADLLTVKEHKGRLAGLTIAFIGDGNNVSASLALAAASVGASFVIASPQGYELRPEGLDRAQAIARERGGSIRQVRQPQEAVAGADVVYTDVWVSMGDEAETAGRLRAFQGYQVTPQLMGLANPRAIFMHDLPAHQGEEISPGMLEHPQSVVFDQAENRLHAQKAVLEFLLGQHS